ncbi:hypothetical protein [Algoriphagus boritolerans]|uniref:hypothetical protein n=1 Tax=Algoriphagus boritolerans TaxID=308111 RepID=UPI000B0D6CBC
MTDIIQNRTVPEKQTALLTLASLEGSKDLPVWKQILADFDDGKLPEGTWIELEEAITQTESSELKAEFTSLLDKRAGDEPWKKICRGIGRGQQSKREKYIFRKSNRTVYSLPCLQ